MNTNLGLGNKNKYLQISFRMLLFVIFPLISGLLSLVLGRDINWDVKNYHYYNAYAFLENRIDFDIAPAQLQTYINPLGDLPFYLMTEAFPSWVAGFVLGFVHGFNLSLILLIFWKITRYANDWLKLLSGLFLVMVSGLAPGFISEVGITMHDNLTSVFVLWTLYLLISSLETVDIRLNYFQIGLASFIMGFGVGIKPSITIFAISTAIALVMFQKTWKNGVKVLCLYGLLGITGGLVSAGFWWWELWQRFGNPFFPFYNHIFKTPYFTTLPVEWSTFIPDTLWEYFVWPFVFTVDSLRVNQLGFFDIRFALLYSLVIIWVLATLRRIVFVSESRNVISPGVFDVTLGNFILFFFFVSYILWILESATYRFMIPLELLTPLCFMVILERIISNNKLRLWIAFAAAIITLITFKPFQWGRLDWTSSYISLDSSRLTDTHDPVVIMLGSWPNSYVIPQFPPQYRFVRPEGNLTINHPKDIQIFADIRVLLKNHEGNLYVFYDKNENIQVQQSLINLNVDFVVQECFVLKINTPDVLELCSLSNPQ